MDKDWRLVNQENYLLGQTLMKTIFLASGHRDHAHCSFCWDKFSEETGALHVGYCTLDRYRWICEQCFQDFKNQFEWIVCDEDN